MSTSTVAIHDLYAGVTARIVAALERGTQFEPAAYAAYETLTGSFMQPLVLVNGDYSASLDGITLDGSRIVESKAPFN